MRRIFYTLLILVVMTACQPIAPAAPTAAPSVTLTPKPTETPLSPTATPVPMVEVAAGVKIPESQIDGFNALDAKGNVQYIQDAQGHWIKNSRSNEELKFTYKTDVELKAATDKFNASLTEAGLTMGGDGMLKGMNGEQVPGVEALADGTVNFTFDGKNAETFSFENAQTKDGKFLVAGYKYNETTKSWEVFDPGFPMEKPEDALAQFLSADTYNGNLLRWFQRATQVKGGYSGEKGYKKYMDKLFEGSLTPDKWSTYVVDVDKYDFTRDGVPDKLNHNILWWDSGSLNTFSSVKKEQLPFRIGSSVVYLVDLDAVVIPNMIKNGDKSYITLFNMVDRKTIWETFRKNILFSEFANICGVKWNESMAKFRENSTYELLTVTSINTDASYTPYLDGENAAILTDQNQSGVASREGFINGDISSSAQLQLWGARGIAEHPNP